MASYAAYVVDNGDGTFTLSALQRNPTTHTISGGTDLTTAAEEVPAQGANPTGAVQNAVRRQPQDVFLQALTVVAADRSLNG